MRLEESAGAWTARVSESARVAAQVRDGSKPDINAGAEKGPLSRVKRT